LAALPGIKNSAGARVKRATNIVTGMIRRAADAALRRD
jgi:hypothetical protein